MARFDELCFEIENIFIEIEDMQYNSKLEALKLLEEKVSALKLSCDVPLDIPVKEFLDDIGNDDIIDEEVIVSKDPKQNNISKKKLAKVQAFECNVCDRLFATKETLRKHSINKHTDLRLYQCDKCDKKFKDATSCKRHVANENLHKKDLKSRTQCRICGKIFSSPFSNQRHFHSIHFVAK